MLKEDDTLLLFFCLGVKVVIVMHIIYSPGMTTDCMLCVNTANFLHHSHT